MIAFNPLHPYITCIISKPFSRHCLRYKQGEFFEQSRVSRVGDHFLYSHDLTVRFRSDIVWRNYMLVTHRGQRVNKVTQGLLHLSSNQLNGQKL